VCGQHSLEECQLLQRALLGPGQAEALRPKLTQLLKMCMGLAPLVARFNERVSVCWLFIELFVAAYWLVLLNSLVVCGQHTIEVLCLDTSHLRAAGPWAS
jgi:hypothetical protein